MPSSSVAQITGGAECLPLSRAQRLLIVDDVADNRAVLARRFQRHGFEITEAADGFRALELITSGEFDLVLLDVMMPGLDGFEVLQRIRTQFRPASLPVIMVTALARNEDIVKALSLGANDYITKPVDFAVALARTQTQLARKHAEEEVQRANWALQEANENLERRVTERTKELIEANERLKVEMTQRERSEATVRHLAHHDALTALANRVLFGEWLNEAITRARLTGENLAVLFLDLDGFKNVNDTLGHPVGDKLLKLVADRLRHTARETDKVARFGGDEFAILQFADDLPGGAADLASKVIDALREPYQIDGQQVVVGTSVGVALLRTEGLALDGVELLKAADLALYRAKAEGRGTFCFFEAEMDIAAQARRVIELELRQAVATNAFELHYQPLVDLASNKITGFEALIRWAHAVRGITPPADFIPLAEETGLIVPIGKWVLRRACEDAAKWPQAVRVAVNLSAVQFKHGDLVETVANALLAAKLQPHRLELEITESVLMDKTKANLRVLRRLKELGVRISLDDFGTGYSSLSYLRDFEFDKIKIDRSFIQHMSDGHQSRAIVTAIAGLGGAFGVTTTAEGVETPVQLERLRAEGCTEVQGFLISRPVPAENVLELLSPTGSFSQSAA
jgi:diguanylate cyclase (GGDEF)-like protein